MAPTPANTVPKFRPDCFLVSVTAGVAFIVIGSITGSGSSVFGSGFSVVGSGVFGPSGIGISETF